MHSERNSPGPVLLAGDEDDVEAIAGFACRLARTCVHGTVLLELPDAVAAPELALPESLSLHILRRGSTARGVKLTRALHLWVQERMPGALAPEPALVRSGCSSLEQERLSAALPAHTWGEFPEVVWVGSARSPLVREACAELVRSRRWLHLHHADAF